VERSLPLLLLRLLLGVRGRLLRCCCRLPVFLSRLKLLLLLLLRDRLSRRCCCLLLGCRPLLLLLLRRLLSLLLLPLLLLRERLLRGCCCCRLLLSRPLLLLLLRRRSLLRLRERLARCAVPCCRSLLLLLLLLRERLLRCALWRGAPLSLSLSLCLLLLLLLLRLGERFFRSPWLRPPSPPAPRVSLLLRPLAPSRLVLRRRGLSALRLRLLRLLRRLGSS
jgi:hypothetical protein